MFVASVGAAGALGGLLLAAVAVNIEKIVAWPALPPRVAQTLLAIGGALIVSSFALFPDLPPAVFGWIAAVTGAVIALAGLWEIPVALRELPGGHITPGRAIFAACIIEIVGLPLLVGGILLGTGTDWAISLIATGVVLSYVTTLVNGWILLIEILR